MRRHVSRIGCIVLGLTATGALPAFVRAQDGDVAALAKKVDPCVVSIVDSWTVKGSGFVVDDKKGLIVTAYRIVERLGVSDDERGLNTNTVPAGQATPPERTADFVSAAFADKKRSKLYIDGFIAVNPAMDLAVLHFRPRNDGEVSSLRLASALPAQGEKVFAFGAPTGLSGGVSEGIVSAIRKGYSVASTLQDIAGREIYRASLGYDYAAQWIQTTAAISVDNSGGPLVNARGEVVGVNTWVLAAGNDLNFCLSVEHLRQLLASAGTYVQPFSNLPAPRPNIEGLADIKKTLKVWNELNTLKNEFNEKREALVRRLRQVGSTDFRSPTKGRQSRIKKQLTIYGQMAAACEDYVGKLKAVDISGADQDLIRLTSEENRIAVSAARQLHRFLVGVSADSFSEKSHSQFQLERLQDDADELRTKRDLLRIKLSHKYGQPFPGLEETANTAKTEPAADKAQDLRKRQKPLE